VTFTPILVVRRDFLLSPLFCVTAVKISMCNSVYCVISAFEWSLCTRCIQESRAVAEKPQHAVVKKIEYVSKFMVASRGSLGDSTALVCGESV